MKKNTADEVAEYENCLNEALRDVVLDIRSVALLDLASFIHSDRLENIGDIFDSAIELNFKHGTLFFSYAADLEVGWLGVPIVSLDVEFHCMEVDIYFKLNIDSYASRVKFVYAAVKNRPMIFSEDYALFGEALQFSKLGKSHLVRGCGFN